MSKVVIDPKKVKEVLERGVEQIFPKMEELEKKLMSGEKIKLYCGFDPSAPSMHIGNGIQLNKLGQFQELGHEVIFLIGDFTGTIGDPTDKTAARKKLTREEVTKNAEGFLTQAAGYLNFEGENPALVKRNSEWSDKLSFKDLIELSSNFTVQQMLARDMFQKRIADEKPIYLHEFLYPLAQGYDSVAMDVDLEIGGNDQMFNMMVGRDLMKALGMRDKSVLMMKLLADEAGKKMGKSEGNAVFLDQSPEDMFGKVMSWTDGVIGVAFELATRVPMEEVKKMEEKMKEGANPKDFKLKLAFEIVKLALGEEEAEKGKAHFEKVVSGGGVPDEVPELKAGKLMKMKKNDGKMSINVIDLVASLEQISSKSEARRLVQGGGVSLDDKVIESIDDFVLMDGGILKVGKRLFVRLNGQVKD